MLILKRANDESLEEAVERAMMRAEDRPEDRYAVLLSICQNCTIMVTADGDISSPLDELESIEIGSVSVPQP